MKTGIVVKCASTWSSPNMTKACELGAGHVAPHQAGRWHWLDNPKRLTPPETLEDALGEVHIRLCSPDGHDVTCLLLNREVARLHEAAAGRARVIPSRAGDPSTSRAAEPKPLKAGTQRARLLEAFVHLADVVGPATDEQAARMADVLGTEYAKRCSELREAGWIVPTGDTRRGRSGLERIVCRVTEAGEVAYRALVTRMRAEAEREPVQ